MEEKTRTGIRPAAYGWLTGGRLAALGAILLAVGFLGGAIPVWLRAQAYAAQRDASRQQLQTGRRELRLASLEQRIAAAAIDARLGQYEAARQAASGFFQAVQQEVTQPAAADLSASQTAQLSPLLRHRDEIITLLARDDPASAERLTQVYLTTRKALQAS
jgi:hypothetical protein